MNAIYIGRTPHENLSYGMTGKVEKRQPWFSRNTGAIYAPEYHFHPHGHVGETSGEPIYFYVDYNEIKFI